MLQRIVITYNHWTVDTAWLMSNWRSKTIINQIQGIGLVKLPESLFWKPIFTIKAYFYRTPFQESIITLTILKTKPTVTQVIDGWVQDCSNSSALAMELPKSCTKPSIYSLVRWVLTLYSSYPQQEFIVIIYQRCFLYIFQQRSRR